MTLVIPHEGYPLPGHESDFPEDPEMAEQVDALFAGESRLEGEGFCTYPGCVNHRLPKPEENGAHPIVVPLGEICDPSDDLQAEAKKLDAELPPVVEIDYRRWDIIRRAGNGRRGDVRADAEALFEDVRRGFEGPALKPDLQALADVHPDDRDLPVLKHTRACGKSRWGCFISSLTRD